MIFFKGNAIYGSPMQSPVTNLGTSGDACCGDVITWKSANVAGNDYHLLTQGLEDGEEHHRMDKAVQVCGLKGPLA